MPGSKKWEEAPKMVIDTSMNGIVYNQQQDLGKYSYCAWN